MRYIKSAVLLLAALFVLSAFHKDKRITIFMVGDSTMANKDISGGKVERGWGMMLCNYFSDDVVVDNLAKNGRSSKSFIDEGRWDKVLEKIT
ncbi:MAG: pectin esterase, partial [Prevotella sp.]|nr:pectin esterase [Prevotella sp.]